MKNLTLCITLLLISLGCGNSDLPVTAPQEAVTFSDTRWTAKTELFMERPPLVVGQTARFAVHFTNLRDFKAVTGGRVVLELQGNGSTERFVSDPQRGPGIFGVDVTPHAAGDYSMTVQLQSPAVSDSVLIGSVAVYPNEATAAKAAPPQPTEERIAFLKEQQWTLDFGSSVASNRQLRASLLVPAEVIPRAGGSAEITVPFSGRVVAASLPPIGSFVTRGQALAQLLPPTSAPADHASLELAQSQATSDLSLARRERERAERLVDLGALPARRRDEARAAETTAEARLKAADARLSQYDMSSAGDADAANTGGAKLFALRAPIAGVVAQSHAAPGANVEAGEVLFQIVDLATVYVSAIVPESEIPLIRNLSGAELQIPGVTEPLPLQHLVSIGRVVDPPSRTFPVIYEVDNRGRRVSINQTVHVRLLTNAAKAAVAIPESAIVDDAGRPIVFVQLAGESFARRPVTLGVSEGGFVQVLSGVQSGERVVTRGAPLIRLASMSSQVPSHGHVH